MAKGDIMLHPEFGVNPTMGVCYICHRETGEIGLLGASCKGEAPRYSILSKEPCEKCKEYTKEGILVAVCKDGEHPSGDVFVVKDEVIKKVFNEVTHEKIFESRIVLITMDVAEKMNIYELAKEDPDEEES
jgi:hypothetical protein